MNFNDTVHKMRVERNGSAYVAEKPKKIKKSKQVGKYYKNDSISRLNDVIRALESLDTDATEMLDYNANKDGFNRSDIRDRIVAWCLDIIDEYNDNLEEEGEI